MELTRSASLAHSQGKLQIQQLAIPVAMALLAIVLNYNTFGHQLFYSWDDNRYIEENHLIRDISPNGIKNIFSEIYFAAYIPVTIFTYAVEFNLWGMNPGGYHIVNVLFHAANSALVFLFLDRLLKRRWVAVVATLWFIVHPLQVETVAWVSQHKNVISMFFTLLALLAHMRSADSDEPRWATPLAFIVFPLMVVLIFMPQSLPLPWHLRLLCSLMLLTVLAVPLLMYTPLGKTIGRPNTMSIIAWFLFLLAALAKPAVVGVPLMFIAYDWLWAKKSIRDIIVRNTVPLLIGVATAGLILIAHEGGGGIKELRGGSIFTNFQVMTVVAWDYVESFVAPFNLNNRYYYGTWMFDPANPNYSIIYTIKMFLGIGLMLGSLVFAWLQPLGKPFSRFAVLWTWAFMLPVLNIVPIAIERADRYMYFPSIVLFALFAILLERIWHWRDEPWMKYAINGFVAVTAIIFAAITFQRNMVWETEGALWKDHLTDYPRSGTGWLNLGVYYFNVRDYPNASDAFVELLKFEPNNFKGNRFMGHIAINEGRWADSLPYYEKALSQQPDDDPTLYQMGRAYYELHDYARSVDAFRRAFGKNPNLPTVGYNSLGLAALQLSEFGLARDAFQVVVERTPNNAEANSNLCSALSNLDQLERAIELCIRSTELQPNNALFQGRLGHVLLLDGRFAEALTAGQNAVRINPNMSLGHRVIGDAYAGLGDVESAIAAYERSLEIDPKNRRAQQGLNRLTNGQ